MPRPRRPAVAARLSRLEASTVERARKRGLRL
jgi:hypothetical protein